MCVETAFVSQEERSTPPHWSPSIRNLLDRLLTLAPSGRVSSLKELKHTSVMKKLNFDDVLNKRIKPPFVPPKDHLNCDPTFELEEMIIETKPLHKKKKRLAKQRSVSPRPFRRIGRPNHANLYIIPSRSFPCFRSLRVDSGEDAALNIEGAGPSSPLERRLAFIPEYPVYNREHEIERQEKEKKEKQWEEELNTAMMGAEESLEYVYER